MSFFENNEIFHDLSGNELQLSPEEHNEDKFNTDLIVEKSNKKSQSYILRMCMAHCAKACLQMGMTISPPTYMAIFHYGPLLKDYMKKIIPHKEELVALYQEVVINRILKLSRACQFQESLNDLLKLIKENKDINLNDLKVENAVINRMENVKSYFDDINNHINDVDYLYKNKQKYTISEIIKFVIENTIYCPDYIQNIIELIEKHFGKDFDLIKENKYCNRIQLIINELHLTKSMGKLLLVLDTFNNQIEAPNIVIAKMIKCSPKQFKTCLIKLVKLGLITCSDPEDRISIWSPIKLSNAVHTFIFSDSKSFANHLLNNYVSKDPIKLSLNDYSDNIQENIKNIITLINKHDGNKPCNILLYGKSGSGKSSLINYLQSVIHKQFCAITVDGMKKYFNAYKRSNDDPKSDDIFDKQKQVYMDLMDANSASERLSHLKLCDALPVHNNYVFIMDECDDSLNNPQSDYDCWLTGKKQLNELLEEIKTPTIWIANHIDKLDESTCRRFAYSIKFEELNFKQRAKVWKNQIKYTQTEQFMKNVDIEQLAIKYKISAGLINSILQSIKTLKPDQKNILHVIDNFAKSHCELIGLDCNTHDNRQSEHSNYSIDGLNIKSNFKLESINEGLMVFYKQLLNRSNKNRNVNILLDGVPGAGKTEYAKYIARYLDAPLITCHGSDFLSKWVGETEQNIKSVFNEAEQTKSVLFIDEADGLIHQRENAHQSWEVTQVNEFLCNMEKFNGILICATNFIKNMDNASIRRFSIKVTFDYLNENGKLIFFKRFFNTFGPFKDEEIKKELQNINYLVPGDFKVVRDKCNFLKHSNTDLTFIINELKDEVLHKPQFFKNKQIGFNQLNDK